MKTPLLVIFLLISFAFINTGCKKSPTVNAIPALTTNNVMLDVTSTTAQSGGGITDIGSSAITANGVCYSTTDKTPTISDLKTTDPIISSSYSFTSNLTGLTPSTTYYLRAYATNSFGTGYGAVVTFSTGSTLTSVAGAVTTFAGSGAAGFADGTGTGAVFNQPSAIASDAQGNLYVSDTFNNLIRKITPGGVVSTVAGNGTAGYADGAAGSAQFYAPQGLAVDATGNVFVADFGNNVIRKISASGTVSTVAGNGHAGYIEGVALDTVEFNGPNALAVDATGNIFVADFNNNVIRKISSAGIVSTVAGTKTPGYVNNTVNTTTGVYASFNHPSGIVLDASGDIFVADQGNNAIREITPAVVVTTVAGGPGQTSLVGYPWGIAIDAKGDLFITDASGRIVELTTAKVLYSLAGATGVNGFADGSGTAAQFNTPEGICLDPSGNIFVADFNNNRIRKVVVVDTGNQ